MLVIAIAVLLGIYYCTVPPQSSTTEGFAPPAQDDGVGMSSTSSSAGPRCPNILVKKDNKITLFNSKLATVPGVNPVTFDSLEDYVEFTNWQRSQGITCPVLFLQNTHDTQGNMVYKAQTDITSPQGGLPPEPTDSGNRANDPLTEVNTNPYFTGGGGEVTGTVAMNTGPKHTPLTDAGRDSGVYNKGNIPAYDQSSYYQGTITSQDNMLASQRELPESPSAMDANWGGKEYTNSQIEAGHYLGRTRQANA